MKNLLHILIFVSFVLTVNAQSEKYIDVTNSSFNIYSPDLQKGTKITRLETNPNGNILDNQQKDLISNRNNNNQPSGTLIINFQNVSQKKIKSVSYLFELTDGKEIFYKNNYSNKLNLLPNETRKIINNSSVISNYLINAVGVERITIKKIVFEDKTTIKF